MMTTNAEDKGTDQHSNNSQRIDEAGRVCLFIPPHSLKPGMLCPRCHAARIDYDGLLNLVCPNCGLTETGAST